MFRLLPLFAVLLLQAAFMHAAERVLTINGRNNHVRKETTASLKAALDATG